MLLSPSKNSSTTKLTNLNTHFLFTPIDLSMLLLLEKLQFNFLQPSTKKRDGENEHKRREAREAIAILSQG